jgi:hypothetical protein
MKITIDPFDSKSIEKALNAIKEYERDFQNKEREFVRRLAEIGVSVAETGFSLADYDGENDVQVSWSQSGPFASVIAFGQTVGFIEFGTGIRYKEYDSSGLEYTPPAHGTYGKGRGANPKGWWFSNGPGSSMHTYGNQPAEAMLTARNEMITQVARIAREVWG